MWHVASHNSSSPGCVWALIAIWLDIVPDGTYRAASLPKYAATLSCNLWTVGSSLNTSSPTSAAAMKARIAGVGRVTVSLRRSTNGCVMALLVPLLVFEIPPPAHRAQVHLLVGHLDRKST